MVTAVMSATAAILLCSLAIALAQTSSSDYGTCDSSFVCLAQGQQNCRRDGFQCATGSSCTWKSHVFPSDTAFTTDDVTADSTSDVDPGTCTATVAVGSACGQDHVKNSRDLCFDPQTVGGVFCNVTLPAGTGTCAYAGLFGPGEACGSASAVGPGPYDTLGGCIVEQCKSGTCPTFSNAASSHPTFLKTCEFPYSLGYCAAGEFCNSTSGDCQARLQQGATCESSLQCDPTLICTTRLSNTKATCQTPFAQSFGDACYTTADCGAGLICITGVCVNPASGHGESCESASQCPDGWACSCHIDQGSDANNNPVYHLVQGSCSYNYAPTAADQAAYNSLQSCLKSASCQDYWWHVSQGAISWNANTCFGKCILSSGLTNQGARRLGLEIGFLGKVGQCPLPFNSASIALLPSLAILGLALLAALAMM